MKHPSRSDTVRPPIYRAQVLDSLGRGPLDDLSVIRPMVRLSWGIRVPGDESHTIYVWLDALTSYLTAVGFHWKVIDITADSIWPSSVQIIGKGILRYAQPIRVMLDRIVLLTNHLAPLASTLFTPAMLLALGLPLPKTLLTHTHWTVNCQKMTKSVGNVADSLAAMSAVWM